MSEPNAKLRALREFVHRYRTEPLQPAGGWSALGYVIEEIDRMLAEKEPTTFQYQCRALLGHCMAMTSADGASCALDCFPARGSHKDWRKRLTPSGAIVEPPPRESSALEVARLYGLVGPDGKGRC